MSIIIIAIYRFIRLFKSIYNFILKEQNNIPQIKKQFLIQNDQILTSSSDLTYNYFQYGLITICTISLLIFLFYFDKGLDKDFDKGLDIDFDKGLDIDIPIKKIYPEYWDSEKMKIFSKPNWRENPQFWYNLNFLGPKEINWVRLWKTFVFTNRFLFGFFNSF
jgi:hypothetical protein